MLGFNTATHGQHLDGVVREEMGGNWLLGRKWEGAVRMGSGTGLFGREMGGAVRWEGVVSRESGNGCIVISVLTIMHVWMDMHLWMDMLGQPLFLEFLC